METFTHLSRSGDVAVVTIDDGSTRPTVFSAPAIESFARCLEQLEGGDWRAVVLIGKPGCFAVGADISQFSSRSTAESGRSGSQAGHELFGRLRALPFVSVAAINGACLGGGLELALHCDARTVGSDVRHAGFPECFLGLIPAWGGTQLLPRLTGARTAVKVIVENAMRQNRMLDAAEAARARHRRPAERTRALLEESIAWALELAESGPPRAGGPVPRPRRGRRDRREGPPLARRHRPRRRTRTVQGARTDRGSGALDARGREPGRGSSVRGAPAGGRGAGVGLRVPAGRVQTEEAARDPAGRSRARSARSASSARA